MNAEEMREIASMLHDILENHATTFDEIKRHVKNMADSFEDDADAMEEEDD